MVVQIVRPDGVEMERQWHLARWPAEMHKHKIGILDNNKRNAADLLVATRQSLLERTGAVEGPVRQKAYAAMQAPPQFIAGLASECAIVLVGSGD